MKCEDFLAAYASQRRWQQWRARRHLQGCSQCAAAARMAAELRRELGAVEPLSPALRELWKGAADEPVAVARLAPSRGRWAALAIAAAVVLVVTASLLVVAGRRPAIVKNRPGSGQPSPTLAVGPTGAAPELVVLLAHVDALEADLRAATKQAELLDARQQANRMIATYSQW
jgi:hypothetical protein